jgi:hypothetical protein
MSYIVLTIKFDLDIYKAPEHSGEAEDGVFSPITYENCTSYTNTRCSDYSFGTPAPWFASELTSNLSTIIKAGCLTTG